MATDYKIISETQGELQSVVSSNYDRSYQTKSTDANFTLIDLDEANSLQLNEKITFENEDADKVWVGRVEDIPSVDSGSVTVQARSQYKDIFDFTANGRVFYNVDSGTVMQKLIEEKMSINNTEIVNDGTSLTDWSSETTIELCDFRSLNVSDYGGDLIYVDIPEGTKDGFNTTLSNFSINGDELIILKLDLILNNPNGSYNIKVELRLNGKNYVWDLGSIDGEETVDLDLSDATTEGSQLNTDGELQIRTGINGESIQPLAFAIDAVRAVTGDISQRNTDFNSINIRQTGQSITRRPEGNVGSYIRELSEESEGNVIVNPDSEVKYKEREEQQSGIIIDENLPIIDYEEDQNITEVVNRVVVEGDGFTVARQEQNSINFYNTVNTERIRNPSIKSAEEGRNKADNILKAKSFRSTRITITLPPLNIESKIEVGDQVRVELSYITGDFSLDEIYVNQAGEYELELVARENKIEKS